MATGISDKVVILGMGCARFGERWDAGPEELMLEAFTEALDDAGIERDQIEAGWLGRLSTMNKASVNRRYHFPWRLRLPNVPVTRVENLCATGSEALRGATYAVASGACDIALALGMEKLKDSGYAGLPERTKGSFDDLWMPNYTAPGAFAQLASAYSARTGIAMDDLKQAMAHVSWKSHQNGVLNPKAHLRKAVSMEQVLNAPTVSYPLGLYDCCGVSDGAACAIVTTPEVARSLGKRDMVAIKSLQLAASNGTEAWPCFLGWQLHIDDADRGASALIKRRASRILATRSIFSKCTTASRLPS